MRPNDEVGRVLLVGHLGIDLGLGPLQGIPPFGQEALVEHRSSRPGGPVTNSGMVFAALGVPWGAVSAVGDDPEGQTIRATLATMGADISGVRVLADRPTSLSLALLRTDGERAFVTHLGAFAAVTVEQLAGSLDAGRYAWLFVNGTCLLPGEMLAELPAIARAFRAHGGRVAVDTGWDPCGWPPERIRLHRELLAETDLFFPNLLEAAALAGIKAFAEPDLPARSASPEGSDGVDDVRVETLLAAIARYCSGGIVLKLGPEGAALWEAGRGRILRAPATEEPLTDTTGAGDAFDAAYLYGVLRGLAAPQRLEFANRLVPVALHWRERLRPEHVEDLLAAFGL